MIRHSTLSWSFRSLSFSPQIISSFLIPSVFESVYFVRAKFTTSTNSSHVILFVLSSPMPSSHRIFQKHEIDFSFRLGSLILDLPEENLSLYIIHCQCQDQSEVPTFKGDSEFCLFFYSPDMKNKKFLYEYSFRNNLKITSIKVKPLGMMRPFLKLVC